MTELTPLWINPGGNSYCGPGALSILTGHDTSETAAVLRVVTGKRAILGVGADAVRTALMALLKRTLGPWQHFPTPVSLEGWATVALPSDYLVNITGHYCVVRIFVDGRPPVVCDNCTFHERQLDQYRHRRRRVKRFLRVRLVEPATVPDWAFEDVCTTPEQLKAIRWCPLTVGGV